MGYWDDIQGIESQPMIDPSQGIWMGPVQSIQQTFPGSDLLGGLIPPILMIGAAYGALWVYCHSIKRQSSCSFPCDPLVFQCGEKVLQYSVVRKYKSR